jgi:hypothetical protein
MVDVISRNAAELIVQPHQDAISSCLYNAWDRWSDDTSLPTPVRPGTRANLVYDYAVAEAWRILDGRTGMTLTEQRGFLLVSIDDALLLRFKKFRTGLVTSGIPTGQQQLFAYQQLTLDAMPEMTKIVAGYLLDEFQREIARAAITCSVGSRRVWAIDLPRPGVATVAEIPTPSGPMHTTTVRSAFPRKDESSQEAT